MGELKSLKELPLDLAFFCYRNDMFKWSTPFLKMSLNLKPELIIFFFILNFKFDYSIGNFSVTLILQQLKYNEYYWILDWNKFCSIKVTEI